MGFTVIAPYLEYPERLLPYLVFMERALDKKIGEGAKPSPSSTC